MSYDHQEEDPISPWLPKDNSLSNHTGKWAILRPKISERCNRCLRCWIFCPDSAVVVKKEKITINYLYCKGCGICASICPVNAIKMEYAQ